MNLPTYRYTRGSYEASRGRVPAQLLSLLTVSAGHPASRRGSVQPVMSAGHLKRIWEKTHTDSILLITLPSPLAASLITAARHFHALPLRWDHGQSGTGYLNVEGYSI
jgi:hypothetical protein